MLQILRSVFLVVCYNLVSRVSTPGLEQFTVAAQLPACTCRQLTPAVSQLFPEQDYRHAPPFPAWVSGHQAWQCMF